MALTPATRVSQATSRAVISSETPEVHLTQTVVRAISSIPAEAIESSQVAVRAVTDNQADTRVHQAVLRAVIRGRSSDPAVRAWTFTIDGHDYYVLRLGTLETLVYDLHSDQWYVWGSGVSDLCRLYD